MSEQKQSSGGQKNVGNKPSHKNRPNNKNKSKNNSRRRNSNRRKKSGGGQHTKIAQAMPFKKVDPRHLKPEEKFLRSYEEIIFRHDTARAKYFELFHRVDPNRKTKLEYAFYDSIEKLRNFEDKMTDEQKEIVEKYKIKHYEKDMTYSTSHELSGPDPAPAPDQVEEDSMMIPDQFTRPDYKEDTEESVGSIDDYKKYKEIKA